MAKTYPRMQGSLFSVVKDSGVSGIRPADVIRKMLLHFPEEGTPHVRTVTRWLREDPRFHRPSGHGYYAVRAEYRR